MAALFNLIQFKEEIVIQERNIPRNTKQWKGFVEENWFAFVRHVFKASAPKQLTDNIDTDFTGKQLFRYSKIKFQIWNKHQSVK
jgi:hypothetical protein